MVCLCDVLTSQPFDDFARTERDKSKREDPPALGSVGLGQLSLVDLGAPRVVQGKVKDGESGEMLAVLAGSAAYAK